SLAPFSVLAIMLCAAALASATTPDLGLGIEVQGSGVRPQIFFACCDQGIAAMQSLFADPAIISDLKGLNAILAFAVPDLSPERAQTVRQLNAAGIPLFAWVELSKEQGTYLNADNEPQAAEAFANFENWSAQYGLQWQGVGLDIEPDFSQLASLREHKWRPAYLLAERYIDTVRVYRAREAYGHLIRKLQLRGYIVQTYQMPLIVADRRAHITLFERLFGVVDVRGDEEVLMLYSSFVPSLGAGMIWSLAPGEQAIAIGNTQADPNAGANGVPLHWDEFSRDLLVASHFSRIAGVYNLEGCVQQGFLTRLRTMNWNQSVLIPADSIRKANRMRRLVSTLLWIGAILPVIIVIAIFLLAGSIWRWRRHRRRAKYILSEVG
ncbi:MAG: hypothetical protein WBX38_15650, partial [Candidatus Sulfotelmatobacter sp.]